MQLVQIQSQKRHGELFNNHQVQEKSTIIFTIDLKTDLHNQNKIFYQNQILLVIIKTYLTYSREPYLAKCKNKTKFTNQLNIQLINNIEHISLKGIYFYKEQSIAQIQTLKNKDSNLRTHRNYQYSYNYQIDVQSYSLYTTAQTHQIQSDKFSIAIVQENYSNAFFGNGYINQESKGKQRANNGVFTIFFCYLFQLIYENYNVTTTLLLTNYCKRTMLLLSNINQQEILFNQFQF
eukprot:TRINITY_DN1985_c0_g1_i4.p1 TRINITY_DN1985_c0_g1~~TRINITY_DN1985_c0_g1_i4.p1  ORF type:complete len:235 (+),score=-18.35 TRINITY_DN1985_c0_g1_i4:515-1219(+)